MGRALPPPPPRRTQRPRPRPRQPRPRPRDRPRPRRGPRSTSFELEAIVNDAMYNRRRTSPAQASEVAKETLIGQRVSFATDPTQGVYDRYGRTLAYLDKADGWDYSIEAARAGAAHAYIYHDQPAARYPAIAAAQKEAIDAQRGLWGPPC